MEKVTEAVLKPLGSSIYMKPLSLHFKQNGNPKTWDMLKIHDSVSIIIFNTTRKVLVFVKQFRPAVYVASLPELKMNEEIDVDKYSPKSGVTLELCAGIVDKDIPLEEVAREEVLEECGYDVPVSNLKKINSYRASVGTSGSIQTVYYCEVTDDMKVSAGGGIGDEIIDVVEMTIPEVKRYVAQDDILSPASVLYNVYWFLYHKADKLA